MHTHLVAGGSITWSNKMNLIADDNGVDIIMSPVSGDEGIHENFDFNFSVIELDKVENMHRDWDVQFKIGHELIGAAKFSAYQFLADGVERRTVALRFIEVAPHKRGQKQSYDLLKAVLSTVTHDCDGVWGPAYGKPVLFIEKRDLQRLPEKDRDGIFGFLRKLADTIFDFGHHSHSLPGKDLVVSPIGEDISIQLIQGHLIRSAPKDQDKD
jgi:hypothetical protein